MKVTISLSEEARIRHEKTPFPEGYMGSTFLSKTFADRGHELQVVHPNDVLVKGKALAKKLFSFKNDKFQLIGENVSLQGDVFFVYGLGEEQKDPKIPYEFIMNALAVLEGQYTHVLNSAKSTSYEIKDKQREFLSDEIWIPRLTITPGSDLSELVGEQGIIAKPTIGLCGRGVEYFNNPAALKKFLESGTENYVFEKFIPANEERRYIFLDNQLVIGRRMGRTGAPAKEKISSVDLMEGNPKEIAIARRIINSTEMFYGAVDFRGEYLLEVNGSGTGIAPPTIPNHQDAYNLAGPIVMAVERKVSK